MSTCASEAREALQKAGDCITSLTGVLSDERQERAWLAGKVANCQDALAHCKLENVNLKAELAECEAKLADCKKKLAEKPKADGPAPELLREFVEAMAAGEVSEFGPNKGWIDRIDFKGNMAEYYREIAKLVLRPKDFDAWEAKYYPVPADKVPKEQRARAALQKWRGMTPEVLAEYGLAKRKDSLTDGKKTHIAAATSCPLCRDACLCCLLYEALDRTCCYGLSSRPYVIWNHKGDAGPMIAALEKAVELEKERYGEVMKAE